MALKSCMNCGKEVKQRYASKYQPDTWLCSECRELETEPDDIKELQNNLSEIIVTTTYAIEGKKIIKYLGVISAEVIEGLNVFKDFSAGISDIFGGSVGSYQKALDKMKEIGLARLKQKAVDLGANAVVGVDLDYGELRGSMLMLVVNGTAVEVT